jgi:hypothetical protein
MEIDLKSMIEYKQEMENLTAKLNKKLENRKAKEIYL